MEGVDCVIARKSSSLRELASSLVVRVSSGQEVIAPWVLERDA